jgi:hypothetical protein
MALTQTEAEVQILLDQVAQKGWAMYDDDTYTEGAPLYVTAVAGIVKLECDGAGSNTVTSELPLGVSALWDTTNDKILSTGAGNAFDVRIDFKAKNTNITGSFDIFFDIGDPSGIVISARTYTFPKGANTEVQFSIGIPLFSMATFVANGCTVYIDSTVGDTTLYEISIFVKQDYVTAG